MWEWLISPIDPARVHDLNMAVAWHGRVMVFAWGILAPLVVLAARYFKVMPSQDWPRELDNQTWWRGHWIGHSCVVLGSFGALFLVLPSNIKTMSLHGWLGYAVLICLITQVLLGVFRGTKGGPTAPAPDGSLSGDHYDMTLWRRGFEVLHKTLGYLVLILAQVTILYGLWHANGLRWMWLAIILWWCVLAGVSIVLQSQGRAMGSYQAIWGPDPRHPGNRAKQEGSNHVRNDRGNGLSEH